MPPLLLTQQLESCGKYTGFKVRRPGLQSQNHSQLYSLGLVKKWIQFAVSSLAKWVFFFFFFNLKVLMRIK